MLRYDIYDSYDASFEVWEVIPSTRRKFPAGKFKLYRFWNVLKVYVEDQLKPRHDVRRLFYQKTFKNIRRFHETVRGDRIAYAGNDGPKNRWRTDVIRWDGIHGRENGRVERRERSHAEVRNSPNA